MAANDEGMLSKVANAIFESTRKQAWNEMDAIEIPLQKLEETFDEALRESDRSAAILIGAAVDDALLSVLERELVGLTPKLRREVLFDAGAPLSALSARTKIVEALGWVRPKIIRNVSIIRRIRNEFAHKADCRTFDSRTIVSLIASFSETDAAITALELKRSDLSQRALFFMQASATVGLLMLDSLARPREQRTGLPPMALSRAFDDMPQHHQAILKFAGKVCVDAARPSSSPAR